ncbi:MAG: hypothetical protein SFY69_05595 [Planctomycetota bacterium]|nr:hypothetical protein [Planctomycetota bacterium]
MSDRDPMAALRRLLWAGTGGMLLADEHAVEVKFVVDPASGRPVFNSPIPLDDAESATLCTPDEGADALQLLGVPTPVPRGHALTARWEASFGRPEHAPWYRLEIEAVRRADVIASGPEVIRASPIGAIERDLCRVMNEDAARLADVCLARAGVRPAAPVALGVDPWGVQVRGRFGLVRLEFDDEASSAEDARRAVERLMGARA